MAKLLQNLVLLQFFLLAVYPFPSFTDRANRQYKYLKKVLNSSLSAPIQLPFFFFFLISTPTVISGLEWYEGVKPQEGILAPEHPPQAHTRFCAYSTQEFLLISREGWTQLCNKNLGVLMLEGLWFFFVLGLGFFATNSNKVISRESLKSKHWNPKMLLNSSSYWNTEHQYNTSDLLKYGLTCSVYS